MNFELRKDRFLFIFGSFFRPVHVGELENDRENLLKYRFGLLKYLKKYTQNEESHPKWNFEQLHRMDHKWIVYMLYVPASFVLAR